MGSDIHRLDASFPHASLNSLGVARAALWVLSTRPTLPRTRYLVKPDV